MSKPPLRMATKKEAIKAGAVGLDIPQRGLRDESFAFLRAGGKPLGGPITIAWYPNGTRHIVDGRHRLTLARQAGMTHITARLIGYGTRLGTRWSTTTKIPI